MLMVVDVFFRKNTRTFLWDQIRRTFWRKFHVFKGWGEVRIDFRIFAFMYCKSIHNHKIHRTAQSIIREKPRRAPIGWYKFWAVTSSKTIRADLSLHYTYISFVSALVYIFFVPRLRCLDNCLKPDMDTIKTRWISFPSSNKTYRG